MNRVVRVALFALVAVLMAAGLALADTPTAPINPDPPDGAVGVGSRPLLTWEGGDDANPEHRVKYFISLTGSPDCPGAQTIWAKKRRKKHWQIPRRQPLPPDTTYTWNVRARAHREDTLSDVWTFTTGSYPFICEVVPKIARPTYAIDIWGAHFGEKPGAVKVGKNWIGWGWGKIVRWEDNRITIVLPDHRCWGSSVPGLFKVKVYTESGPSNFAVIAIYYGGGGTTW